MPLHAPTIPGSEPLPGEQPQQPLNSGFVDEPAHTESAPLPAIPGPLPADTVQD